MIEVSPGRQEQLTYVVGSDADEPIEIDLRFSHRLGPGRLELVEGGRDQVDGQALIGEDTRNPDTFVPGRFTFEAQLYSDGDEISLDGQSGSKGSGLLFTETAQFPGNERAILAPVMFPSPTTARSANGAGLESPVYLCATSVGELGRSWDRVLFTVRDNTGAGVISKGAQFRLMFSGVPLGRSTNKIPATSDPIPPLIIMDTDAPLHFYTTGVKLADNGREIESGSAASTLLPALRDRLRLEGDYVRVPFALRQDRKVPSSGFIQVSLIADEHENLQATAVFNYREYAAVPLKDLMRSTWARRPEHDPRLLPPGRPHWESSMALCDKSDSGDDGYAISLEGTTFFAKHLNARRAIVGSLKHDQGRSMRPAIWRQRHAAPETLSEMAGGLEGANDNLAADVCGFLETGGGNRPFVWRALEGGWESQALPIVSFASGGRALDINDVGQVCGFVDTLTASEAMRLPCLWRALEDGTYEIEILPVPDHSSSAGALALNNRGVIVGWFKDEEGITSASFWEPMSSDAGYRFVDLKTAGVARGINAIDQMVGGSDKTSYLWQCGERHPLAEAFGMGPTGGARVLSIGDLGDLIVQGSDGQERLFAPITELGFHPQ